MTAGPAASARLLFLAGSDQHDRAILGTETIGNVGSTDLYRLLAKRARYDRLHVTRHFFRQGRRPKLHHYLCLVNLVTDPDQNPKVLENLRKFLRNYPGRVINRPEAVLQSSRDQVAKRLTGTPGLVVPKTLRLRIDRPDIAAQAVDRAGLQFPVILRRAGTHTGKIVGVFDDPAALRAACGGDGDHIVTEFIDFRSNDGKYRKYRSFFIGRHIILRHMLVSDQWNVHAKERQRFLTEWPELLEEERQLLDTPQGSFSTEVLDCQQAIRERMPLDFFGMDYGIGPDGRVILFEANATMNFFPFIADPRLDYVKRCYRPAQEAFWEMLGLPVTARTRDEAEIEPV
jgi:hypothetical protein